MQRNATQRNAIQSNLFFLFLVLFWFRLVFDRDRFLGFVSLSLFRPVAVHVVVEFLCGDRLVLALGPVVVHAGIELLGGHGFLLFPLVVFFVAAATAVLFPLFGASARRPVVSLVVSLGGSSVLGVAAVVVAVAVVVAATAPTPFHNGAFRVVSFLIVAVAVAVAALVLVGGGGPSSSSSRVVVSCHCGWIVGWMVG